MSTSATKKKGRTRPPAALSNEAHSERQARVRLRALGDQVDVALEDFARAALSGLPPGEQRSAFESVGKDFVRAQARIEAEDMKARRQADEIQEEADRRAADEELKAALEDRRQASRERAAEHEQDMRDRELERELRDKEGEQALRESDARAETESQWERLMMRTVIVGTGLTVALFVVGFFGGYPTAVTGSAVTGSLSLLSPLLSRSKGWRNRKRNGPELRAG